ncbi:[FeFe] hydrogenase H-cluster radical SAM maturase HydE [Dethiobacter alkaliphilus]|uniref:Radical SAM domain protein n=1 Tax=Dethiobacter alkaliphilus AHT 1 TaxID=555088 RepID=C0GH02_DETAL|nr:[FeFe] hydrogenase H-cluster radical SAM maturase HydE [Dethiobacter alkaliphilus]EEG77304.1 Radical SAM domain protein [Dethiobacter alkaliphilus AHT 1]
MGKNINEIIEQAVNTGRLTKTDVVTLLSSSGEDAAALFAAADGVRKSQMGDEVHLRGLIEFSNYCERNCTYCGLRSSHKDLARYRMEEEEILAVAAAAVPLGYRTVVLQSGEDSYYDAQTVASIVHRLKKELGLVITLSLGERNRDEYKLWKDAGADRYLLKHETADADLYAALHPDMTWERRRQSLLTLRELGYQVGSGCMVGLPGQTLNALAEDLLFLQALDVEMAGIGPFVPNPHTPLAKAEGGTVEMTLKMIAVARLLLPKAHLPATTALGSIDKQGRQKALTGGANVVMPNITPNRYRRMYEIYPNKICLDDNPAHCRNCIGGIIASLGRHVADGPGHSPKDCFSGLAG